MKNRSIAVNLLQAHPKRDNVCPPDGFEKIKRHIQRTGNYEPLVVYSDPAYPNVYTLINGHVRWAVAQSLGWTKLECYVWEVTPAEAELALATLNTLRGTSDRQKRADLLASLSTQFSVEDLGALLPEGSEAFEDMLAIQAMDMAQQELAFQEAMEAERQELPVTLSFVVMPEGKAVIEDALALYAGKDRGESLIALCTVHLEANHA